MRIPSHAGHTPSSIPNGPQLEARVAELLGQLTLAEAVILCHAGSKFTVSGVPRLGIPEWTMSDGPHGVRREIARDSWDFAEGVRDAGTYLPTGTCLAATWDPAMARLHGEVLGAEARARGKDVILGPGANLIRTPLCGRNFEYLSEDPELTAALAAEIVRGIQSQDVAACVKHFACNNQELDRHGVDATPDEAALRETELIAFERCVREAGVWTVMGAYNRVHGVHACHHRRLLVDILKGEWGFRGAVVSDWGGVHDARQAATDGLDVEMGTEAPDYDAYHLAGPLREAITHGRLPADTAHAKAERVLRVMAATGCLDPAGRKAGAFATSEHAAAAQAIAAGGIVLLRNEGGLLPLRGVRRILVVGEHAVMRHATGGFSSGVRPAYETTPLEGLRAALEPAGCTVLHHAGRPADDGGRPIARELLSVTDASAGARGWFASLHGGGHAGGPSIRRWHADQAALDWSAGRPADAPPGHEAVVRFSTVLTPPWSGRGAIIIDGARCAELRINGELVAPRSEEDGPDRRVVDVAFVAGRPVGIVCDARPSVGAAHARLRLRPPGWAPADDAGLEDLARSCDQVVFVGGLTHQDDTESTDRRDLVLPDGQDALIERLLRASPRLAVVIVGGSAVAMPWYERVPAVIWGWYAGMEGGRALADILTGAVEPSGRMPFTVPMALEDSAPHALDDYRAGICRYREGSLCGHRWFDRHGIAPRIPFGHGLGYARTAWSSPVLRGCADGWIVELVIGNRSEREAIEVVQIYAQSPDSAGDGLVRRLVGFAKLAVPVGASRAAAVRVPARRLARWDAGRRAWVVAAGGHRLVAARSAADLVASCQLTLASELVVEMA